MKNILLALLLLVVCTAAYSQTVYKTPSGKKYHLAACRMVKNVSAELTVAQAQDIGLEPCKICSPPTGDAKKMPPLNKTKGTNKTVQCNGQTKAGNRCKHMTSIANGYCYQHQP